MSLIFFLKPVYSVGAWEEARPLKKKKKKVYRIIKSERQIEAQIADLSVMSEMIVAGETQRRIKKRDRRSKELMMLMEFMEEF